MLVLAAPQIAVHSVRALPPGRSPAAMDPTVAPGVANIEAGVQGFQVDEVMRLLRCVRSKNIIGGDVVCIMPTKDSPNQITAHTAASVMFEMISLISDSLANNSAL